MWHLFLFCFGRHPHPQKNKKRKMSVCLCISSCEMRLRRPSKLGQASYLYYTTLFFFYTYIFVRSITTVIAQILPHWLRADYVSIAQPLRFAMPKYGLVMRPFRVQLLCKYYVPITAAITQILPQSLRKYYHRTKSCGTKKPFDKMIISAKIIL